MVWIQIKMSGLIWVQTVWKGYQQMPQVTIKELINNSGGVNEGA